MPPKLSQKPLRLPNKHEKELHKRGYQQIAGVDEAGRGPLAGPVVAAACIIKKGLFFDGINDSKKLTAKKRQEFFDQLIEKTTYGIGIVEHTIIDEINILQATHLAMRKAIQNLPQIPEFILVDGWPVDFGNIPSQGIIQGESQEQLIAAASVLAKVTRDRIMLKYHELYPGYGFDQHKGYGTRLHKEALMKLGPSPIHRLTFSA